MSPWGAAVALAAGWACLKWLPRVQTKPHSRLWWEVLALAAVLGAAAPCLATGMVEAVALAVMAAAAAVLVGVDLAEHRLPDTVIGSALGIWAVALLVTGASRGVWPAVGRSVAGGAGLFLVFLVLAVAARGGLGFGDVKLAGLLGAVLGWFGWAHVGSGAAIGFVLHGLAALVVLVATRDPKADVPMGPSLIAGAVTALALLPAA